MYLNGNVPQGGIDMLDVLGPNYRTCDGASRRSFLKVGFLGLAGLIGGGPTFIGTMVGYYFVSDVMSVLFLSLAAGALVYIIGALFHMNWRSAIRTWAGWGIFAGFLFGYLTDLILTAAGV